MGFIQKYIDRLSGQKRYSQRTCELYSDILTGFASYAESGNDDAALVEALNPSIVRSYEVHLMDRKKLSPRTVNLHLSVLSGFCRWLMKEGRLKANPVRSVSRPKEEKRLPVFYREESMDEFYRATTGTEEFGSYEDMLSRLIVSILYSTGIRRSELIGLRNDSVDFSRKVLRVRGKGDKVREIPLLDTLAQEISLYLQKKEEEGLSSGLADSPLLLTKKGNALYPVLVDRAVKKELSKVPDITARKSPHALRHTLATELLDGGTDINCIKELLGHSSLAATQVYTHNSIAKLKSVYKQAHPRATKNGGKHGDQD